MKPAKIIDCVSILLIIASFAVSFVVLPDLPTLMASHWNTANVVDGYIRSDVGVFLFPTIIALLFASFKILPSFDPYKENYEEFRPQYEIFTLVFTLFFSYVHILTLAWNLGYTFNMSYFIVPALGCLFYIMGDLMEHTKRNWFVGMKNPWTLSSEIVWRKTNTLCGMLFKFLGGFSIVSMFMGRTAFGIIILLLFLAVISSYFYSYILYKNIKE